MFRPNEVKRKLVAGEPIFGVVHTLAHAPVAELLGLCGCDFVLVDGEHGQGGHQQHLACLQALSATGARSIVRLPSHDRDGIKRILDLGAEGIMIPNVSTAKEARAVVAACRYPPRGVRGYAASGVRASDYGVQAVRYLAEVERELLVCVMIETGEGVRNAADIAAVEGVDVIQIGANDLSYDLGVPEQLDHPILKAAVAEVEAAARAAGRILGGAPAPGRGVAQLVGAGYRLITIGRDASLLAGTLTRTLAEARAAVSKE